jgi:hypothetical protein
MDVSVTGFVHAVLRAAVQNNISPLYAQYEQCACVTVEPTSPHRMPFNQLHTYFTVPLHKPSSSKLSPKSLLRIADAK